mgnify:CR=1 FL=1
MRDSKLSKIYIMTPLALLCCFLWGSAFPMVKIGYEMFSISESDTASQILFAGIRFALAGALVIVFGSLIAKKPLYPKNKAEIGHCLVLSLFQTILQYMAFYIGLAHTSGVKSSVLVALNVFLSLILSALVFRMEKLTAPKVIGVIIGFAGVVLINFEAGGFSGFSLNGEGAILFSAFAYSVSSVLIKKYSVNEDPVMLSGWQFLIGGIIMALFAAAAGGRIHMQADIKSVLAILYLALISAVAYTVWGLLLKYNPVSRVAVMGFMNPVFGVLLSALFLGETAEAFSVKNLVSLVLVCIGIYIVNAKFSGRNKPVVDKS